MRTTPTFTKSNASESHSIKGPKKVLFALWVYRSLSFRWCRRCCCCRYTVGGARTSIAAGILNVDWRLNGSALLTVNRLHNGTGGSRYALWIVVHNIVRVNSDNLRRISRLVLKLNGCRCLRLDRCVVIGIRITRTAMTRTVIGT